MLDKKALPEGFMEDHMGRLVPVGIVKEVDKLRDELVKEIVEKAEVYSVALAEFKRKAMADILSFVALSIEKYGVKVGGAKGNVTLMSFDGRYKVIRSINEYITFDERLEAAKGLMDECLENWTAGASDEIRKIINFAFEVDKTGKISTSRIMGLLRVEIDDPTWKRAMEAIADSIQPTGSKAYIRIYRRVEDSDKYEPINLDLAVL